MDANLPPLSSALSDTGGYGRYLGLQERLMDFEDWLFLFDIVELVKDLL